MEAVAPPSLATACRAISSALNLVIVVSLMFAFSNGDSTGEKRKKRWCCSPELWTLQGQTPPLQTPCRQPCNFGSADSERTRPASTADSAPLHTAASTISTEVAADRSVLRTTALHAAEKKALQELNFRGKTKARLRSCAPRKPTQHRTLDVQGERDVAVK